MQLLEHISGVMQVVIRMQCKFIVIAVKGTTLVRATVICETRGPNCAMDT